MNDKFTNNMNPDEDDIARKLNQVADQTHASGQFAAELEQKLRGARQPKTGWLTTFTQISPTLRWVALIILLAVVLSWSIQSLIPAPQPAAENTPVSPNISTPAADEDVLNATPAPDEGIEFRGANLFMSVPLPNSPGEANVYTELDLQPATAEYAQALAQQFGIQGELYITQGQLPNSTAYMATDGKHKLVVYAENNYTYTSDMVENSRTYNGARNENAETIIREFLQSHGYSADVQLVDSGLFGGYALQQLSPDGLPIEYDNYSQPSVRITLNEDGSVLSMTVLMVSYDLSPVGSFGIIGADEALQILLNDNISTGKLETSHGGPDENFTGPQIWYHEYPDNQRVTIYGNVSSSKAVDPSKPAVVFIDTVQVIGNIEGMETLENYAFVQATGKYVVENGVRKFDVEAWDTNVRNANVFGGVRREGDQILVSNEDGSNTEYVLIDPPVDLPSEVKFPESQVNINGANVDGKLDWTNIYYYADASNMGGGGGGGGGLGFYQLNLSGTPIPFPTATPVQSGSEYTAAELASFIRYTVKDGDTLGAIASAYNVSMSELSRVNNLSDNNAIAVGWVLIIPGVSGPTRLDGEEGTMQVQIFQKPDGRLREAYTFISKKDQTYYQVQGENLKQLQDVANRPIRIWGRISYDQMGSAILTFEKFESLYPDLQFEILAGTQQNTEIDGLEAILFTTGGTTYIQVLPNGGSPDYSAYEGSAEVQLEVLRIPGETYAGYPSLRVFNSGPTTNPATGEQIKLHRITDQIEVHPDPYGNADTYVPPDVTIERVELVYLTNNPAYRDGENTETAAAQDFLQPAWHFQGRYSNGDVLDILVQALEQEYLSPELSPHTPPG
jgi:LysM repeat protein